MTVRIAALAALCLAAQGPADSAALRATALDYAEGWYEGNPERMARAVHPELVKRIVVEDTTTRRSVLSTMGASSLVNATRHGYGTKTAKAQQEKEVRILDLYPNAGVVRSPPGRADRAAPESLAPAPGGGRRGRLHLGRDPGAAGVEAHLGAGGGPADRYRGAPPRMREAAAGAGTPIRNDGDVSACGRRPASRCTSCPARPPVRRGGAAGAAGGLGRTYSPSRIRSTRRFLAAVL